MLSPQLANAVKLVIRRSPLAPVLRKYFRRTPFTSAIEVGQRQGWAQAACWVLSTEGQDVLANPDFHRVLREEINTEIPAEFLFIELRRQLLFAEPGQFENPDILQLLISLIQQSINNEYVWQITEPEHAQLAELKQAIAAARREAPVSWTQVARAALYARPSDLPGPGLGREEFMASITHMPEALALLLESYLANYEEEQSIKQSLERFDAIQNETSRMIAENYEEYPYPRWIHLEMSNRPPRRNRLAQFFEAPELGFLDRPFKVLVAGCGTGNKAIEYAMSYGEQAEILAIDLSTASLAYATRKAREHGVSNLRFMQMDLLDLPRLEQQFDIVECTGVLHHMRDPLEGGKALVSRVRDGGIVHISLYSELARRQIVKFREQYRLKPDSSDDEIRAYRRRMMEEDPQAIDERLSLRWDFFDLNRCKDLLFHPLEHRFTVPQIGEFLDALGLEFRGLEKPDYDRNSFVTRYPDSAETRSLEAWHAFELRYPDAFGGLYEIWARKPV